MDLMAISPLRAAYLLFLASTVPLFGAPQLHVPQVNAAAGSTVVVPVFLEDATQLSGVDFAIDYDTAVLTPADQPFVRGDLQEAGTVRLLVYSSSLKDFTTHSGILVQLLFHVSEAAQGDTTDLELHDLKGLSAEGVSVDVSGENGSVMVNDESNPPELGENRQVFSQVANGTVPEDFPGLGGDSFDVSMLFVNRTAASSTAQIGFFHEDGSPFALGLKDGRQGSEFSFILPPGGSTLLQTDGQGDFGVGYAVLTSSAPLGGTLLFALRTPGGATITEAGVASSVQSGHFSIPVLFQAGSSDTGIAFANPLSETADLALVLKDANGVVLETTDRSLGSGEHIASFSTEFFKSSLESLSEFHGSIEVQSSIPVYAIALKQQGAMLTTFPVVTLP
jgi:hypothetical protein